ncbi:MAG TPA: nucleotidyltransferase family protein [Burkholderiales bacterium]|jgi:D-glycero-alpha-D-manno-heptose 1-phosphate guanylyltransferase
MEAVVLAGGLGTRLRAAVSDVPKPMAPVGGRPFLERLLDYWIAQGVSRAVLAAGYMYDSIRRHFGDEYRGCAIAYSIEDHPLGTGGALVQSLPLVHSETFLVLNGDTYFAVPLEALGAAHRQRRAEVTMSLFRSDNPRYMGIALDASGRVTSFAGHGVVNGGVFLFERAVLAQLPPGTASLERDVLPNLGGAIYGCVFDVPFVDIGVPEDWRAAANILT